MAKYLVKEIDNIRGFNIAKGYLEFLISDIQSATFENAQETVWATGRNGVRLGGFDTGKTATLSGENGSIETGLLAAQVGSDVETVADYIGAEVTDVMTVPSGGVNVTTNYTATGTVGNEIGFIYVKGADGGLGKRYTQGAAATATEFSYTPGTKTITLPTGVFSGGETIVAFYKPTLSTADVISNRSDSFSKTVRLVADTLFRDQCTQKDYWGQIVFSSAKADGNFSLTFGGDPSVQAFKFDALLGCGGTELWDVIIFDEADAT